MSTLLTDCIESGKIPPDMKTVKLSLQWVGLSVAVVCSIFIGLTPAWVFALGWWLVPGLRGVSATIGLLVFIVVQVIAWPAMCLFWDKTGPHDYTDGVEKKMCHILEKMTPWLAGMLAFAIVLFEMLFWLG